MTSYFSCGEQLSKTECELSKVERVDANEFPLLPSPAEAPQAVFYIAQQRANLG